MIFMELFQCANLFSAFCCFEVCFVNFCEKTCCFSVVFYDFSMKNPMKKHQCPEKLQIHRQKFKPGPYNNNISDPLTRNF